MNDIEHIDKTTTFNVLDEYQHLDEESLKKIAQAAHLPYAVALANIKGDLNVGFIVRSAAAFAAEKVFVFGRRKWDRRSAVGSNHYVPVESHAVDTEPFDWETAIQTLRADGYTPWIVEQDYEFIGDINWADAHELGKVCLVFGPEDEGIPKSVCADNYCVSIPQYGIVRSLNVASAAAIAIHHVASRLV